MSCCAPAATPSRAAPPRSSRTSSPSACSACPGLGGNEMRFTLTDDQNEIKRIARDLLTARAGPAQLREHAEAGTYDEALWKELRELGWPGIAVSEEHGGQGLGLVELCVLVEELGYACAAVPFLGTAL